jgi:hypothetical protein
MARQLAAVIDNGTGYTKMGYEFNALPFFNKGMSWLIGAITDLQAMIRRRLSSPQR